MSQRRRDNRSDQSYRKRRAEDDWQRPYGNKPKKKSGSYYDSKDHDYQYIHKDRKQYSRDQLLALAPKAKIDDDLLEDLSLKFDLVFSMDCAKPIGDTENELKGERFLEYEADKDFEKKHQRRERSSRSASREQVYSKKKEFVKFDEFAESLNNGAYEKLDRELETKYKRRYDGEEQIPEWATEDLDADLPLWSSVDAREVKQQTSNPDSWTNNNLKVLNKEEELSKKKNHHDLADEENEESDDERDSRKTEENYYGIDPKTHRYKFYDEFDEEENFKPLDRKKQPQPEPQVPDITSLWRQMKQEEEEERLFPKRHEPEIIDANFYEEELREKRREKEEQNRLVSGHKPDPQHTPPKPDPAIKAPNLIESLGIGKPQPSSTTPSDQSLHKLLGSFAQAGKKEPDQPPSPAPKPPLEEDIDIIEGPPPSLSREAEVLDEKTERSRKEFQEKYFAMDKALHLLVFEALNSKRRDAINWSSKNGLNQASVEKYCANKYKIFSFLMQGDVFSKIWFYKDKVGNLQGPFMSFDMDVWNGESKYFSKSLMISPNRKDYFPLSAYLNRDEVVLDLMQDVASKQQQSLDQQPKFGNNVKIMYPHQLPMSGWVPPPLMAANVPLMPFIKGKPAQPKKRPQAGDQPQLVGLLPRPAVPFGLYPGVFLPNPQDLPVPSLISALSSPPNPQLVAPPQPQPKENVMTQNLKQILGLFPDPAIQQATPASSFRPSQPAALNETDFPPISKAFKS